jgi:protein translocase SEC61 complex gamma subunit
MQPRKGHSKQASPLRTDPPKTKGNSLRKSDSQLYSTAPTLLSHSINSTNDTHFHLSLSFHQTLHTDIHTYSNHVVKPNARDHGDAPRVHQGRHSIHQPLHVCCLHLFLPPCCPFYSSLFSYRMLITPHTHSKPDKREFLKIGQAVGVGFLVMGVIGYIVKLSKYPLSQCCRKKEKKEEGANKGKTHSSHPRQQHSRRWRINVSAIPIHILRSSRSPSYPFQESDIKESKGAIIPFRKIRQKPARYLFATHPSKYLFRCLFSAFLLVQFSFLFKSEGISGVLRENEGPLFDTNQSANTKNISKTWYIYVSERTA